MRTAVVGVVVVALAVGGWVWWRHSTQYHEHVSGAQGSFPTALGSAAPDAPGRVLRRTSGSYGLDGDLSIDEVDDGIAARDLRTGKDYWRYGRDGTELGEVAFTGTGDTVATWWRDGVVVATDVRTGKPRWHAKVTYGDPLGSSNTLAELDVVSGLVVAESRDQITAFAADSGKRVWKGTIPKGCTLSSGGVFAMRDAVVARAECKTPDHDTLELLAFDVHHGTVRWQLDKGLNPLVRVDDHTLATASWDRFTTGATVDVSGAKPVIRTWPSVDARPSVTAGAGIVLCVDNTDKNKNPEGTLVGLGATDGHQRWTHRPAKGTRFGTPLLTSSGRIYVIQQPDSRSDDDAAKGGATLVVLDAATGRQLHAMPLPSVPRDATTDSPDPSTSLTPWQAVDGVVAIQWTGMFSGTTADLLVVAE